MNSYVLLDGKKYKVYYPDYKPEINRQRTVDVGLTGKTIIQDFTVENRVPKRWTFKFKVFINDPDPDYGDYADFETAYHKMTVPFVEHDGTPHTVVMNHILSPEPRTVDISGACQGAYYITGTLEKVYS